MSLFSDPKLDAELLSFLQTADSDTIVDPNASPEARLLYAIKLVLGLAITGGGGGSSVTLANNLTTSTPGSAMDARQGPVITAQISGKQDALGFTAYNATNPSGYQTSAQVASAVLNTAFTSDFSTYSPSGNGTTNDAIKLSTAISDAVSANKTLVLDPTKTYRIGSVINLTFTGTLAIKSSIPGRKVQLVVADSLALFPVTLAATAGSFSQALTANLIKGQKTATFASSTGLNVGDLVLIGNTQDWPIEVGQCKRGEYNTVESISGGTVTFRYPFRDTYTTALSSTASNWRYAKLDLTDVELVVEKLGTAEVRGLRLQYLQNSTIDGLSIKDAIYAGVVFDGCVNTEMKNSTIRGANEVGVGYGFYTFGGRLYKIHHNLFVGNRKGGDFESIGQHGPTRDSYASHNVVIGEGTASDGSSWFSPINSSPGAQSMGFATHGPADGITFSGNYIYNCAHSFQIRGQNVVISDNHSFGKALQPWNSSDGGNHIWENNTYTSMITATTIATGINYAEYPVSMSSLAVKFGYVIFKNNISDFVRNYGIYADGLPSGVTLTVQGNDFLFTSLGSGSTEPYLVYLDGNAGPVTNLKVTGNTITGDGVTLLSTVLTTNASYASADLVDYATCDIEQTGPLRIGPPNSLQITQGERPSAWIWDGVVRWMYKFSGSTKSVGTNIENVIGKRTTVANVNYTLDTDDYIIAYTSLTATRAVTLGTPSNRGRNRIYIIKDEAGTAATNAITLVGTVDGVTNKSINTNYGSIRLYHNGTAWFTC